MSGIVLVLVGVCVSAVLASYPDGYDRESRYAYHGRYGGHCGNDGFYYRDHESFVICSNGNAYEQPCAPGSKNSGFDHYNHGNHYYYRDFCDINLVDHGYGAHDDGYAANREHQAVNREGYAANREGYVANHDGYAANRDGYGVHHDGYAVNRDGYGAHHDGYAANRDGYGAHHNGYAANRDGYGAHHDGYAVNREVYHDNRVGYASNHRDGYNRP